MSLAALADGAHRAREKAKELKPSDWAVLYMIAYHQGKDGAQACYASLSTLAEETGLGRSTVIASIKRLAKERVIVQVGEKLDRRPVRWRVRQVREVVQNSDQLVQNSLKSGAKNDSFLGQNLDPIGSYEKNLDPNPQGALIGPSGEDRGKEYSAAAQKAAAEEWIEDEHPRHWCRPEHIEDVIRLVDIALSDNPIRPYGDDYLIWQKYRLQGYVLGVQERRAAHP